MSVTKTFSAVGTPGQSSSRQVVRNGETCAWTIVGTIDAGCEVLLQRAVAGGSAWQTMRRFTAGSVNTSGTIIGENGQYQWKWEAIVAAAATLTSLAVTIADPTGAASSGNATLDGDNSFTGSNTFFDVVSIDIGVGPTTGISNPGLLIIGNDGGAGRFIGAAFDNSNGPIYFGYCAGGTRAAPLGTPASYGGVALACLSYDTNGYQSVGSIGYVTLNTATHSPTHWGGYWELKAAPNGTTTVESWMTWTERAMHQYGGVAPTNFAGNKLAGRNSGAADTVGMVGETVTSYIDTAVNAAATGTYLTLTSITLTAGKWLLMARAETQLNSATITAHGAVEMAISPTIDSTTGTTSGLDRVITEAPAANSIVAMSIPARIVNNSITKTYYLVVLQTYSAGTPQWRGSINAVRLA